MPVRNLGMTSILTAAALLLLPLAGRAADSEMREFAVSVDGKSAGKYHMGINRSDDGTQALTGFADISYKASIVYTYKYTIQLTEVWKDGRLLKLQSKTNDDGKKFDVTAVPGGRGLQVTVNGKESTVNSDAWVTSYWSLPDVKSRNGNVNLLDADTGKEIAATLQLVGSSNLNVNGSPQKCNHYRLTGGVTVDLWYDAQDRLVRQESVEDGHKTVLELSQIKK